MIYVGVDVGATNLRAVVGDETATILGSAKVPTPKGPGGVAVTEALLDAVREACAAAGVDPTTVEAAGIASIGPLDLAAGAVDNPANFPDGIGRIPLTGPLGELLDTDEVYLHNDADAGVIGERFHAERNPDDMVYLTISSGIGAGVAVDGHVLAGWDGNAGEVGHTPLDPAGGMTCGCGRDGHWEAYCSGENIPRYARRLYGMGPDGAESAGGGDGASDGESGGAADGDSTGSGGTADWTDTAVPVEADSFSAADVFAHAGEDAFADHVVDRIASWNAQGVATLVQAYAPLVITIGGAVALENPELVVDPIRDRVEELAFGNVPEVRTTDLGDEVVVEGALASAISGGTGDHA